eukprot:726380-Pyramimonas_sp.AAC.1
MSERTVPATTEILHSVNIMAPSLHTGHALHARGILREARVLRTTSTRTALPSHSNSEMILIPRAAMCQLGGSPHQTW